MEDKKTVSVWTIVKRINRYLRADEPGGDTLRRARSERERFDLGEWYAVDAGRNYVSAKDVDPENWAKEFGLLKPGEVVA